MSAHGKVRQDPRESRALDVSALLAAMPEACAVVDREHRIVAANAAYARVTGAVLDDLVGRSLLELFPDAAPDLSSTWLRSLRASIQRVFKSGASDVMPLRPCRLQPLSADGARDRREPGWWRPTHHPMRDASGGVSHVLQRLEEVHGETDAAGGALDDAGPSSIDAQRARLHGLIMQAPIPVAIFRGPRHEIELVNRSFDESLLAGRSAVGKTARDALPEAECQGLFGIFDLVYRSGQPFSATEFPLQLDRRGDGHGEETWWNLTLQATRGQSGEVDGLLAMALEVTELKRADTERTRLLERERAARAEAEKANRAKDEFLAMLGHELRNPLSPIVTALQLIRMREGGEPGEAERVIERQVQHLVRLVDDLLDISRITRGKVQLKRRPVELWEVAQKAIETTSPLLEQRQHRLDVDVPRTGLRVDGDELRLSQVIANLLSNAAKYTEAGGRISVRAARVGDKVELHVRDNGMGITPDMMPRIFELFVQGQRALDRAEGGLGIGLTLVRNLVSMHGGTVEAHSEGRGRGSDFVVRLPALGLPSGAHEIVEDEPAPHRTAATSLRVLVVDDNADAAELLGEVLRTVGHEVAIAYDGPQALQLAASFDADVALLDIGLPVMDGYELARRLHDRFRTLRLVAVTGYGQEHDHARSKAAGFERHFVKPVDANALLQALEED